MRSLLAVTLTVLTGCRPLFAEDDCNDAIMPALLVQVDGLTESECSTVTVVVRDGSHEEVRTTTSGCVILAAWAPGTYQLVVAAPGFGERRLNDVVVESRNPTNSDCPPEGVPRTVRVLLSPAPSSDAAPSDDGG